MAALTLANLRVVHNAIRNKKARATAIEGDKHIPSAHLNHYTRKSHEKTSKQADQWWQPRYTRAKEAHKKQTRNRVLGAFNTLQKHVKTAMHRD